MEDLGGLYKNLRTGSRKDNLDRYIGLLEEARELFSREAYPEDWGRVTTNLANTYKNRLSGSKADNVDKAIALFESSLEVYTREAYPES
jgi:hypothetical protein